MHFLRFMTIAAILVTRVYANESEWSRKTFSAPSDQVFAAAFKSIAAQHHKVKSKDEVNRIISFHVGMTLTVWGYDMVLKVTPGENNTSTVSIDIAWPHGRDVIGGSGKKEVKKILKGIEKQLAKAPVCKNPPSTACWFTTLRE